MCKKFWNFGVNVYPRHWMKYKKLPCVFISDVCDYSVYIHVILYLYIQGMWYSGLCMYICFRLKPLLFWVQLSKILFQQNVYHLSGMEKLKPFFISFLNKKFGLEALEGIKLKPYWHRGAQSRSTFAWLFLESPSVSDATVFACGIHR